MALFESYERREKQVLAVLKEYGIDSIEGAAEKITKAAGLDVYKHGRRHSADLLRKRKAGLTPLVQQLRSRRAAAELLTLLLQSVKVCRHSAFRVLLLTRERLVWATVIWARCCWKKTPSASHSWQVTNPSLPQKVRSVLLKRQTRFVRNRCVLS